MQGTIYSVTTTDLKQSKKATGVISAETLFKAFLYFMKEAGKMYRLREDEIFDAYSDAVLQVVDNIKHRQVENRTSVKGQLHDVFHGLCVNRLRKKSKNEPVSYSSELTDSLKGIADSAKSTIDALMDNHRVAVLKNKIEQLSAGNRQLLTLFAEGYTDEEIASIMGYKSTDVVKTTRLRCLDKLKRFYYTK